MARVEREAPAGPGNSVPGNWDEVSRSWIPDNSRPDDPRSRVGAPLGWMDGGVSSGRPPEMYMATSSSPAFDRIKAEPPREDGKTYAGGYLPAPFIGQLPVLDSTPSKRVYRDPPITTLDDFGIEDVRSALAAHTLGQFLSSARLADVMTGDDRIASVLGTRVKGMLGLPFRCEPSRRHRKDEQAIRINRKVKRLWSRMVPRPQVAEFLQWGIQMGFALAEVVWRVRKGMWIPTIRTWHPQLVYYRYDERAYYVITMDGPIRVVPGDGKWILYAPHGEYRGWMHGIVRTCAAPWRYRTYGMRDWARHAEKHGMPWVLPRVPRASSDVEKNRFFSALNNLGAETTIVCPQVDENNKFDVDLKEAAHPAAQVFEGLIERCDTLISCAILGQNLTTEVQGGSYAAATVHGQVRQDFLEADAYTLAECLRLQLLRPFCAYNFEHGQRYVPQVSWDTTPPSDKKLTADVVKSFGDAIFRLAQAGFPLDVAAFAEQFGVPVDPSGKSHLLKPPNNPFDHASMLGGGNGEVIAALREFREQVGLLLARQTA